MLAKQAASALFQRKQIQQHLQPHTVEHIAIVKIFFSGLVVYDAIIFAAGALPNVYPIHIAPQKGVDFAIWNGNGRESTFFPRTEADLKALRLKAGLA